MKKIGLIDYYLSEWHANHYPDWIRDVQGAVPAACVCYAWAELDKSPLDGVTTAEWCQRNGAERCESIGQLCEKSDAVIILAPSNPETHLAYAKEVFPYGKPTFIDKTFAPDLNTAEEIAALAEAAGTPFFSTSALRFAQELEQVGDFRRLTVTGGGSNLSEYIIHPLGMAVVLLQEQVRSLSVSEQGEETTIRMETDSGRLACIRFAHKLKYMVYTEREDGAAETVPVQSDFFRNLMAVMLRFFETGKPPFLVAQTMEVMRLRDAVLRADGSGQPVRL